VINLPEWQKAVLFQERPFTKNWLAIAKTSTHNTSFGDSWPPRQPLFLQASCDGLVRRLAKMKKNKHTKPHKIGIRPVHPIATFIPPRKRLDLLTRFQICFADLFPPGVKLTANEFKVLFVLRGAVSGINNIAAVDQQKIAELSSIRQPHIARAIAGLRSKGMVRQTWMEPGSEAYRNIYELWLPPELKRQNTKVVLEQRDKARMLEQKADALEKKAKRKKATKASNQAQAVREQICTYCGGEGITLIGLSRNGPERWRWCICLAGDKKAKAADCHGGAFVPDELVTKMFGKNH
jgi:hypothetical protein